MTNVDISQTLSSNKTKIYVMNHQDCGAFKVFLPESGYPKTLGANNPKEIEIQTQSLLLTKDYLTKTKPGLEIILFLIDINGSVAEYDGTQGWQVIYTGPGKNPLGLWWNTNEKK